MAVPRDEPYVWLTWLAQWMSGDKSCEWAVWFRANWRDYERAEDDTDFSVWRVRHTKLLRETHIGLNREGYRVKVERQNHFSARYGDSPCVIGGQPDLIALGEGDNIVLDVKTGKARDWHEQQVLLPMALLRHSNLDEHRERRFRGRLVYEDGLVKELHARQAEDLLAELPYFLEILSGPEREARRVPSPLECRYCPISGTHCPERIEPTPDYDDSD